MKITLKCKTCGKITNIRELTIMAIEDCKCNKCFMEKIRSRDRTTRSSKKDKYKDKSTREYYY